MKDKNIKLDINVKPPEKMSVDFLGGVEVVTLKGKDGKTPTKEELESIIKPLIPEPIKGDKGDKGDSYVLSSKDKKEIAKAIDVPIVEKVIEKIEVIKEVPAKLTSKELTSKINELENVIDKKVIKGLGDFSLKSDLDRAVSILDQRTQFLINRQNGSATSGLSYQGTWNANTNTPTLASGVGTSGHYYIVSVAGSTNLDGITDWAVGDWAIFSSTGVWQKIDNSDVGITSINGLTATTQTFLEGTSGTDFNISSVGSVHTFNLPAMGSGITRGILTDGTQELPGDKYFSNRVEIGDGPGTFGSLLTINTALNEIGLSVYTADNWAAEFANDSNTLPTVYAGNNGGAPVFHADASTGNIGFNAEIQNGGIGFYALPSNSSSGFGGNFNNLITGSIANFTSNSSSTGTRTLVTIKNDHASAVNATVLETVQDSTGYNIKATGGKNLFTNPDAFGQTTFFLENDLGTSTQGQILLGGSATALANIFGVDRKNRFILASDGASSSGMAIGTLTNDDLIIGTNNINRVQILGSNGYVGVGTTAPTDTLEVGGTGFVVKNSSAIAGVQIAMGTSNADGMWIAGSTKADGYTSTLNQYASKWLINGNGHSFQTSGTTTIGNSRTWVTRIAISTSLAGTDGDVGMGGTITSTPLLTGAVLKIRNASNIEHTATGINNTNSYNIALAQGGATNNETAYGTTYTSSGRTGGTTKLFKGTYTSSVSDSAGHTVTIFSAENISGSSQKTAYKIGTGYSYSILDYSGNYTTADIDLTIQTANLSNTNADGYNIRITAADGFNSGVGAQDGGNIYIRGGEGINGGDFGHLYLNSDGSNEYGYVGVGSTGVPLSRLDVAGSFGIKTRTVTTTPVTAGDEVLIEVNDDTIGGAGTVNLPASAGVDGRVYIIKKTGTTGNVTVDPDGTEKIDGASTKVLTTQYEVLRIVAKSSNWSVI